MGGQIYYEIIICAVIIFFACEYSGIVSTGKFVSDYKDWFTRFMESDYEFLLKARYGTEVNVQDKYNARLRYALIAFAFTLIDECAMQCLEISD